MDAKSYTTWQLARLADVTDPDEPDDGIGFDAQDVESREGSAGAQFLRSVAYAVEEYVNDAADDQDADDRVSEIADSAVPVYTHQLWLTFVDLAAYTETVSDYGGETDDLSKSAGVALYAIAERLARALIDAEQETDDDDE